jgi:hypothetical protein
MPTLTVRRFEYEELKARLKPDDRVVILSCGSCAKQSDGLGGDLGMRSLADRLLTDGFNVAHQELLPVACSPKHLPDRLGDERIRKLFEEADVIIPLSCQLGIDRAKQTVPGLTILNVTKTLGKGHFSPESGARLTKPEEGLDIEIESPDGVSLSEVADLLGMYPGSF